MLIGTGLVAHSLWIFHCERTGKILRGPQISVKFFKQEITGTRPLAIFVIGATFIIFSLNNLNQIFAPPETPNLKFSVVPTPLSGEYREVKEASHPSYEGLRFLKDVRVIDLRSRLPVPQDKRQKEYSPVTWIRYTLLEKLSPSLEVVGFEFGTSGVGLSPRCLTHKCDLLKVTAPHFHGDVNLSETWQVLVNVKEEKLKVPFMIINEATYWNAFDNEDKEWASMTVEQATELIAMIILFPQDKPIKDHDLYAYPHKGENRERFRDSAIAFPSENRQVFVWKIDKPKVGYTYQLNWTW